MTTEKAAARIAAGFRPSQSGNDALPLAVGNVSGALRLVSVDGYEYGVFQIVKRPFLGGPTTQEVNAAVTREVVEDTGCKTGKTRITTTEYGLVAAVTIRLHCSQ